MSLIRDFIEDVDWRWTWPAPEKLCLQIIGSTALMLQTDYVRGTKDSDVLETVSLGPEIRTRLETHAGPGTEIHKRHKIFIEIVPGGLPLLPPTPNWIDLADLNGNLVHFRIEALGVVDVVVSKLKRFHGSDQRDIEAMIDRGLVPHTLLVDRFKAAAEYYMLDARAEDLPKYVANLHRVERDMMDVPETFIELPEWLP